MPDTQPDDSHRGDEGDELETLGPFTQEDENEFFDESEE
jgi:hypothetical protein